MTGGRKRSGSLHDPPEGAAREESWPARSPTKAAEPRRSDAAGRESAPRETAILDSIPDIAWLKDRESRFLAVNEPFGQACGVDPLDLVGKTDLDIWRRDLAES